MQPDWTRLAPNVPLGPDDPAYVARPGLGQRIPDWVQSGRSPVLVAGPVGVGKSTELAVAARALQSTRVACLVPLDRLENMRRLSSEKALLRIAERLANIAVTDMALALDATLLNGLVEIGALPLETVPRESVWLVPRSVEDVVLQLVREVSRLARRPVTLLIDGLEKTDAATARAIFDALAPLSAEAELVVVVPWHAAYGPSAETVIGPGEKLFVIPLIDVEGDDGARGIAFFKRLTDKRLEIRPPMFVPDAFAQPDGVLDACAKACGGIPRTFLQILADAAAHARITDGLSWPEEAHLAMAVNEQRDSFRRLLQPGDDRAIRLVDGTDGREMALDQKLRLLSHGLILERLENGEPVMRPHPIVRSLLKKEEPA